MNESKKIVEIFLIAFALKKIEAGYESMLEKVAAHQVQSENKYTITRSK